MGNPGYVPRTRRIRVARGRQRRFLVHLPERDSYRHALVYMSSHRRVALTQVVGKLQVPCYLSLTGCSYGGRRPHLSREGSYVLPTIREPSVNTAPSERSRPRGGRYACA